MELSRKPTEVYMVVTEHAETKQIFSIHSFWENEEQAKQERDRLRLKNNQTELTISAYEVPLYEDIQEKISLSPNIKLYFNEITN